MVSTMIFIPVTIMFFGAVASLDLSRSLNLNSPSLLEHNISIVGGYKTTIEEHPHQIYLDLGGSYCGGFIISENYIVTAAHCIQRASASVIRVRAGSTFANRGGTVLSIAEIIHHPNYNSTAFNIDVGLLKTATPIKFSKTIQAIKLAARDRPDKDNSIITVTGWGSTDPAMKYGVPDQLMGVNVPSVNRAKCTELYSSKIKITENMLCAGEGGKGACYGDSGGPATQDGVAVGIVSFGYGCARDRYPAVYARVAAPSIRDFIKKHAGV